MKKMKTGSEKRNLSGAKKEGDYQYVKAKSYHIKFLDPGGPVQI